VDIEGFGNFGDAKIFGADPLSEQDGEQGNVASSATDAPSVAHRAGMGAAWIALEMIGVQGISLLVFSVVAHFVTPREFGLVSLSFLLIYSLRWLLSENVVLAIMRKSRPTDLEYTTAFWLTLVLSVVAFIAVELSSLFAGTVFHAPDIGPVLQSMGFILIFMGLARTHEAWMMRNFRFRSLAARSLAGATLGGLAGVACAMLHMGVWALVIQQVTLSVSSLIFLWVATPWRPAAAFCTRTAREILKFLSTVTANSAVSVLNDASDTLLVAMFYGATSVGLYSTAKRLRLAMQLVASTPVTGASLPALAEAQHDKARFQGLILQTTRVMLAVTCPIFLGAAMVSHDLFPLLFGPKWAAAADAFSILSVTGLLALIVSFLGIVLLIRNHQHWNLYLSITYTVLALPSFVLLKGLGERWMALPFLMPYLMIAPVALAKALSVSDLTLAKWVKAAAPPVVAALAMAAIVVLVELAMVQSAPQLRLLASILLGAASYVAAIQFLAPDLVALFVDSTNRIRKYRLSNFGIFRRS